MSFRVHILIMKAFVPLLAGELVNAAAGLKKATGIRVFHLYAGVEKETPFTNS